MPTGLPACHKVYKYYYQEGAAAARAQTSGTARQKRTGAPAAAGKKKKAGGSEILQFQVGSVTVTSLPVAEWPWKCGGETIRPYGDWWQGTAEEELKQQHRCTIVGYVAEFKHGNGDVHPAYISGRAWRYAAPPHPPSPGARPGVAVRWLPPPYPPSPGARPGRGGTLAEIGRAHV